MENEKPFTQIVNVPYGNIVEDPNNARRHFDPDKLASLAASIKATGLEQFPLVTPIADNPGTYRLISGARRYRAVGILGWPTLPCVITEDKDEGRNSVRGLVSNLQRVDITPYEVSVEVARIKDQYKLTGETIAKMTGLSTSYVNRLVSCQKLLADDVKAQWKAGNPRATVDFLAGLTKVPREKQIEAFSDKPEQGEVEEKPDTGGTAREKKHNVKKAAENLMAALLQMSKDDAAAVNAVECVKYVLGARTRAPQGISFKAVEE